MCQASTAPPRAGEGGRITFLVKIRRYANYKSAIDRVKHLPAETLDGHKITVKANIEFLAEAQVAIESGAEGIGLYRTEYLYLLKRDFPDEQTRLSGFH